MSIYKGIFWYNPNEHTLITKKVACNAFGTATEAVEYSSKSGNNFNHRIEWEKLPKSITDGHPYNYYPRGRVEVKREVMTLYLHPVLRTFEIENLIGEEFGFVGGGILVREVADGSSHYAYQMDYPLKRCNVCGKAFDLWDNQEDFGFDYHIGYGSRHDMERIQLHLCCDCFDKTLDWLLPQCKINPMSSYNLIV